MRSTVNLDNTALRRADLSDASLTDADLSYADLGKADVTTAHRKRLGFAIQFLTVRQSVRPISFRMPTSLMLTFLAPIFKT